MSFELVRTPTLEAVATRDERALAGDLRKRVEEALAAAESQEEVMAAAGGQREAEEELARLRKAERALSQFAKSSREQALAAAAGVLDAVIETAISLDKPDFKKLPGLLALENQNQFATRAIERLVEHLIPLAHITALRAESHALEARARAVERMAQERAEKILGQVRDAVSEEMVLPIDLSKGVSGALITHAGEWQRMAVQISADADRLERSYTERRRA